MLRNPDERNDFSDAIRIVSSKKGILPLVVEKDFWITWSLKKLFSLDCSVKMVFKGGTSLSKAYNLINRMSEDCDITLNRADLGFYDQKDPMTAPSRKQRDKLLDELRQACSDFILNKLMKKFENSILEDLDQNDFELIPEEDSQSIRFYYPKLLENEQYTVGEYIRQSVLFEFGVRGDIYPTNNLPIKSYIEEDLEFFKTPACLISCLSPIRTFWEKATLLHAEYYRPQEKATPERLSRHYYDIYMMFMAGIHTTAMQEQTILQDVIKNKSILFPCSWAQYPLINTEGLKLLPSQLRFRDLEKDYSQTREMMIYGDKPSFKDLLEVISKLEQEIHIAQ